MIDDRNKFIPYYDTDSHLQSYEKGMRDGIETCLTYVDSEAAKDILKTLMDNLETKMQNRLAKHSSKGVF